MQVKYSGAVGLQKFAKPTYAPTKKNCLRTFSNLDRKPNFLNHFIARNIVLIPRNQTLFLLFMWFFLRIWPKTHKKKPCSVVFGQQAKKVPMEHKVQCAVFWTLTAAFYCRYTNLKFCGFFKSHPHSRKVKCFWKFYLHFW